MELIGLGIIYAVVMIGGATLQIYQELKETA